jgi:hypothetical protein
MLGGGRLLDRNWVGCGKGILERVVEGLFLVLLSRSFGSIELTFMRFALRIGIHFKPSYRIEKDDFSSRKNGDHVPRKFKI